LGRFISRDTYDGTIGNPITLNHYLYANSNPVLFVDPSGYVGMIEVSFDMSVMNTLDETQLLRVQAMRKIMEEAGCFVITETLDMAVKEGIYMWIGGGSLYVGKSNVDIEARIRDHIKKKFEGAEKKLKNLMRIKVDLPPKLLETMEQAVMEIVGRENLSNKRWNYSPKKPRRKTAYRRFKRLLQKLCK
jgi:hypothetical protein